MCVRFLFLFFVFLEVINALKQRELLCVCVCARVFERVYMSLTEIDSLFLSGVFSVDGFNGRRLFLRYVRCGDRRWFC